MAVVVAGTIQGKAGKPGKAGKAGKTGPGQTKPRLGTTGKPAKPKQYSGDSVPKLSFSDQIQFSESVTLWY